MPNPNQAQWDALDRLDVVKGPNYPFGDECPACKRPQLFTYTDGSQVCEKCDELVQTGVVLANAGRE